MEPVAVSIDDIVHQIHAARQRAEDDKGSGGKQNRIDVVHALAEDQAGEDKQVLAPLFRAQ